MQPQILFLCTGNYYRSRFAEQLFNHLAASHKLPWQAFSRGLAIELLEPDAGPISPFTLEALASRNIKAQAIRPPIRLVEEDLRTAEHVIALKQVEHLPMLKKKFPAWVDRVEFWHVHDIDCASPEDALPQIEQEVLGLMGRLALQPA